MVYLYNGVLYNYKKESSNDTCYNIYEHHGKGNKKSQKARYHMVPLVLHPE